MTEIKVPTLGESVTEAIVAKWLKAEGESVAMDEPLVELETDKVTLEVNAPEAGVLSVISVKEGETVEVGALLGELGEGGGEKVSAPKAEIKGEGSDQSSEEQDSSSAVADAPSAQNDKSSSLSPAVRKMINDNNLDASDITGTGKDGRLTKEDVQKYIDNKDEHKSHAPLKSTPQAEEAKSAPAPRETKEREERVRMTKLRQTIANRLKEAQTEAAILTTFNEIDMGNFMDLRNQYKDAFEKKHGVKLGFMSIFVKAAVQALKEFPAVNAEIDGTDIIYKNYYDIGVAVSTPQGLVVPNVRDADQKSFAEIEKSIGDLAARARDGKLGMDEMMGGTFTITNGGVFGSMMSTPILNRPQSAILGMHKTQMRPMVMPDGSIEARPMMYVALSYDHRIVDGRESVSFLVRIKEALEDPARLLMEV
jgi:2-oxoglutarate dehydrogenase E2 component (dihydrolipoamide succinyltransferase)